MLTLVWDVDDVLNDFMRCWLEQWWNPITGSHIQYNDLISNPPHDILGVSLDKYRKSIDAFRLSEKFETMEPNKYFQRWFQNHGHSYRHIALTAVPRQAASHSANWVFRHFGDWIRTFAFVPSKRRGERIPEYDTSKNEYLKWLNNADVFIDDNESNIAGVNSETAQCLIVSRPWNSSNTSTEKILSTLNFMRIK